MAFNHDFNCLPYMLCVVGPLDFALAIKQDLKAGGFLVFWYRICHGDRRCVGARGVLEGEYAVVLDLSKQTHGFLEVGGGFAREADDDVGGHADGAAGGLDPGDALKVPVAGVLALHEMQDARRPALDRKMDVVAEGGYGVDGLDDVPAEVARVRCCEADA